MGNDVNIGLIKPVFHIYSECTGNCGNYLFHSLQIYLVVIFKVRTFSWFLQDIRSSTGGRYFKYRKSVLCFH